MLDVKGKKIQHGDHLRIEFIMNAHKFVGLYRVNLDKYKGMSIELRKIIESKKGLKSSFKFNRMSWGGGGLLADTFNLKLDNIAISDQKSFGIEYSNQIEIVNPSNL